MAGRQKILGFTSSTAIILALSTTIAVGEDEATEGKQFTEAGEEGAALPEMVVEAQNQVRQDIQKSAFDFELTAAEVDSFYTVTDAEALGMSPVSGLQPHLNNLETLASDQPPHYWLPEMSREPVATFYPEEAEGHKVRDWKLVITDFRGSQFREFTGGGTPPQKLEWDGRGDDGTILEPGYPYSYVFSLTDKGTNTYNHAGVSFRVPGLDYHDGGNRHLELAGDELFSRFESELGDTGRDWLTRASDVIREHPYSPVRVYVLAEDLGLAEDRADAVASFLASSMIVPREQIETEAEQRPDLRSELDGRVRIVIEHAE